MPQMCREYREKLKRILYRLALINLVDSWLASIKFVAMPKDREHRAKLRSRSDYRFSHYLFKIYHEWNKYRKCAANIDDQVSVLLTKCLFERTTMEDRSEKAMAMHCHRWWVNSFIIYAQRIVCLICSRCNSIYRVACYNNCTLAFISSVN